MEILQLKYFQYTAKSENISHTAHKFMVPPSSVSASIKKLETELGVKLFDRGANTLKLNENGKIFLRALDASEMELHKAKIDILNNMATQSGEIKLLIMTNRSRVTDAIAKFKFAYPDVSFSITHSGNLENHDKFDVIISDKAIDTEMYEVRDFVSEEVFLAVPCESKYANMNSIKLTELKDAEFISMPHGSSIRDLLDRLFKKFDLIPEIVIETEDPHYVCKYIKMGLGVAFFPSVSWEEQISDNIKLVRINDGLYRNSYMYVNKTSSNIAKLFADKLSIE